ncbi:hypothetical protein SDC9_102680 [bioreactor metagenome]|uniref:Uncharacterized protein n=1 Tax=bioreactor metagenome TaxID=1076179 RepID=A0A645ARI4_9ZZZZ
MHIKIGNRTGRSDQFTIISIGENQGGLIVGLGQSGCHDSNYSLIPIRAINHSGEIGDLICGNDLLQSFCGGAHIHFSAGVIQVHDFVNDLVRPLQIVGNH